MALADEKRDEGKPDVPSQEFQNFQNLLEQVFSTPKEKVDKRRVERKR